VKQSFPPIANARTSVLILGTLPGDRSLELGQYYGHPGNRFWKVIAAITKRSAPSGYAERVALLLDCGIGVWDVAHSASRAGSSDSDVKNVLPNHLEQFIAEHGKLRTIGFNGKKPEQLHDSFFARQPHLKYLSLPSTSPANARIDLDGLCAAWARLLDV